MEVTGSHGQKNKISVAVGSHRPTVTLVGVCCYPVSLVITDTDRFYPCSEFSLGAQLAVRLYQTLQIYYISGFSFKTA